MLPATKPDTSSKATEMQIIQALASLAGLPFAFNGYSDLWAAMDGKFGSYIHSEIEKKTGLHVFEKGWDAGFRDVFTAEHPIHNAEDMKGLKLRIPAVTLDQSLFKALGSAPTPVPSGDVYTALQTHLVDGAEDPLITIESSKYYEASKYISLTKHQPTPFEMLANGAAWRRLPKKLQNVLSDNLNETGLVERKDIVTGEDKLRELLKTQGQTFIEPDRESFRDVVRKAGLYSQWRDGYGGPVPFGLLEQVVGKLA